MVRRRVSDSPSYLSEGTRHSLNDLREAKPW
jgi:hypothetical protein